MDRPKTETDDRFWDALARWEELYQQGHDLLPEDLCRDHPENLDRLKQHIHALKRMAWLTKPIADTAAPAQPQDNSDQTPRQLGEYDLLERIGSGGMGQVFKAVHRRMDRIVAIKLLPRVSADSATRFQEEVRAAAKLLHPNIVTSFDAGEHEGVPFLVMEFIEGIDLAQHIQRHGPLSVERAVDFVLQAARGLEYAHAKGVIHRDIKPSNLILTDAGTVKLLDLGLAQLQATHRESAIGTTDFLPPEVVETGEADQRGDIYSLGCTLYFLLSGRPPFAGKTVIQTVMAHREQPIPSLKSARPDVPAALDGVFQRLVAKQPQDRYQSMAEVIVALEGCKKGRDWRWVAVLMLALAVGVGVFAMSRLGKTTAPTTSAVVPDTSNDRHVAEWALQNGGKVKVVPVSGGGPVEVKDAASLPTAPFRLKELDLSHAKITDADLGHLHGLPDLMTLRLNYLAISDAGLAQLHDLSGLSLLELVEARITDQGLKHLKNLPTLSWLSLDNTFVTDDGLMHLKALPRLCELRLNRLKITDRGLVNLEGMTELRLLELYECDVTDAGIGSVKKLKNLTWLNLVGTKLSDDGLDELKQLEGLKNLFVARTKVTDLGFKNFQAARPFCKVLR